MTNIRLSGMIYDSLVDGEGIRDVIFTQGCTHNCKGCHNPDTHDLKSGYDADIEKLARDLNESTNKGVTISGGEPFLQIDSVIKLLKTLQNKNIWCYTGFTYEELKKRNSEKVNELLDLIDVLVDGKYIEELKTLDIPFVGSKNQKIIKLKGIN